ncbi:MAG: polysulfide reductase NrfD [Planctomycetes bacterium]|nr:polysulfide reductase NrfD [Planctomycetota bacterium]
MNGDELAAGGRAPAPLPFGIERLSVRSVVAALLLLGGLGFGLYAYAQQLLHGDIVTGLRNIGGGGATWGLYIVLDITFVGFSFAAMLVVVIERLFHVPALRPVTRLAEWIALLSLVMGGMCVLADLGRPLRGLLNLPRYARITSPFFGTFALVIGGYLFASLVQLFLSGRADAAWCLERRPRFAFLHRIWAAGFTGDAGERWRHARVSGWMAVAILPLLVIAHSTLGFIFGIQAGRPGWFSALAAPGFLLLAGVSGIGLLLLIATAVRRLLHVEEALGDATFRWLGGLLLVLTAAFLYLLAVEELTAWYAASQQEQVLARERVMGRFALPFWTMVGSFVVAAGALFLQWVRRHVSWTLLLGAALLVNVGAFCKRWLTVVPSQTHGMLLPFPSGDYTPTWIEWGVAGGALCVGALLLLVVAKLFPLVPVDATPAPTARPSEAREGGRGVARALLACTTFAIGSLLLVAGFLWSARYGSDRYVDPPVPYSPVIFIVGVMMTFYAAAVFETVPFTKRRAD